MEATEPIPPPAEPIDATGRVLATTALGLTALVILELLGTIAIGMAVEVNRLNVLTKQGYAFLTQMEKSSLALTLVAAALAGALATYRNVRTDRRSKQLARYALFGVVVAALLIGLGSILGVMARFRLAELASSQPVDSLTRRVLVVFVIRNFGLAVAALLVAVGALSMRRTAPPAVD